MSRLTGADVATLNAFFASPLSRDHDGLAAQSFEPRGAGYQPSTDTRLAALVFHGVRQGKNAWARMKRTLDLLSEAHIEVLRLACQGWSQVACRSPRAIAAGRKLAAEQARMSALRSVILVASDSTSPITLAMRVLEADRAFVYDGRDLSRLRLLNHALEAVESLSVDVTAETDALIDAAADAYHAACAHAVEWKQATARREDQRRADLRAELAGKRDAKDRARFDARLRTAS